MKLTFAGTKVIMKAEHHELLAKRQVLGAFRPKQLVWPGTVEVC